MNVTRPARVVANQEYIPLSSLGIGNVAPLGAINTVTTVNKGLVRIAAPCARIIWIMITIPGAVVTSGSLKLGDTDILKHLPIGVALKRSPTSKVNILIVAVLYVYQHIARLVNLHHVPCRSGRVVKTSALRIRKVGSSRVARTCRKGDTIRVVLRTERVGVQTKIIRTLSKTKLSYKKIGNKKCYIFLDRKRHI